MGSYSSSTSNATDNRVAATDSAFGLSSAGNGNNTTLSGHVINIGSTQGWGSIGGMGSFGTNAGNSGTGSAGGGGVNILDAGAIDKAFDFAAFSLSETLGAIIGSNKQASQVQQNTMETIGAAITQASTNTQQATQAAVETAAENQKKIYTLAAIGFGAWWFFFRGKK